MSRLRDWADGLGVAVYVNPSNPAADGVQRQLEQLRRPPS